MYFLVSMDANLASRAVGVSISQTLLITKLQASIPRRVPSISPEDVIKAGASNFNLLTTNSDILNAIRGCWADAVQAVFIFAVVASAISLPFACGIQHLNVHTVMKERKQAEEQGIREVLSRSNGKEGC